MKLFQYALIWRPTEVQTKEGKKHILLNELTTILAPDEKAANMIAARAIPDEYVNQLDQIEIACRPF